MFFLSCMLWQTFSTRPIFVHGVRIIAFIHKGFKKLVK